MWGLYNWLMQKVEAHATPKTMLLNPNFYQDYFANKNSYGSNISIVQKYLFEIPVQCISRIRGRIAAQDQVRFTCGGALVD